jgi:DNA-binding CsgD family transcriptional regulator
MRVTSKPEIAARIFEAAANLHIVDRLASVSVPTLVMHALNDARVPYTEGCTFATGIPGARFVALEGRNHILLESEPAWARFCATFADFVGRDDDAERLAAPVGLEQLTHRERDILCHLACGLSNAEIAARVFISEKTVRNHLSSIFGKLAVESRAKAIVLARSHGLVR